jgi:hypothetical protein
MLYMMVLHSCVGQGASPKKGKCPLFSDNNLLHQVENNHVILIIVVCYYRRVFVNFFIVSDELMSFSASLASYWLGDLQIPS